MTTCNFFSYVKNTCIFYEIKIYYYYYYYLTIFMLICFYVSQRLLSAYINKMFFFNLVIEIN